MPRKWHTKLLAPSVTDRIIDFHLPVYGAGLFPAENPKLVVHHSGRDAGAGSWHRSTTGPAIGLRVVNLEGVYLTQPESSTYNIKLPVNYSASTVIAPNTHRRLNCPRVCDWIVHLQFALARSTCAAGNVNLVVDHSHRRSLAVHVMTGGPTSPRVPVRIIKKGLSCSSAETVELSSCHSGRVVINRKRKCLRKSPRVCNRIVDFYCGSGNTIFVVTAEDVHAAIPCTGREFLSPHRHRRA